MSVIYCMIWPGFLCVYLQNNSRLPVFVHYYLNDANIGFCQFKGPGTYLLCIHHNNR